MSDLDTIERMDAQEVVKWTAISVARALAAARPSEGEKR